MITQRFYEYNSQRVVYRVATIDHSSRFVFQPLVLTICPMTDQNFNYYTLSENYSTASNFSIFSSLICKEKMNDGMYTTEVISESKCLTCKVYNLTESELRICYEGQVSSPLPSDVYVLSFVHFEDEEIVWDGQIDSEAHDLYGYFHLSTYHIFKPLNSDGLDYYSVCYTKCLNISINSWRSNQTLDVNPYSYVVDPGFLLDREDCMRRCGSHPYRFITGEGTGRRFNRDKLGRERLNRQEVSPRAGKKFKACLRNNPGASVNYVEDVENYKFSQLVSDIFSITGFCFGISVIMIWKMLFEVFGYTDNNKISSSSERNSGN